MGSLAKAIEPNSGQLNADDLVTGPMTIKITGIGYYQEAGKTKISIRFDGDEGKPWKPCRTTARLMATVWKIPKEDDGSSLIGHSLTIYRDPAVKWSGMAVGGIRISHMDGLEKDHVEMVRISRGKSEPTIIHPLKVADIKPVPATDKVKAGTDKLIEALKSHPHPLDHLATPAVAKQMAYLQEHRPELLNQVMDALPLIDRLVYQVTNAGTIDTLTEIMNLPDCENLNASEVKQLSAAYEARCKELEA